MLPFSKKNTVDEARHDVRGEGRRGRFLVGVYEQKISTSDGKKINEYIISCDTPYTLNSSALAVKTATFGGDILVSKLSFFIPAFSARNSAYL
mmetsp:Transcript_19363/g.42109  ORF Transcript_19363/g.42109 Transcript_19363/m.42109 type:complete len:93 (-) Transcript_19363:538-816(-)